MANTSHVNPPAFNPNDPRYQRDVQRLASKLSMSPGGYTSKGRHYGGGILRSRLGEISAKHAGYQMDRNLKFMHNAAEDRRSRMRYNQGMYGLRNEGRHTGLKEKALKYSKKQFLPDMLLRGGGMIYSYLDGRDRAAQTREDIRIRDLRDQARHEERMRILSGGQTGSAGLAGFDRLF